MFIGARYRRTGGGLAAAFGVCCEDLVSEPHWLGAAFSAADERFDDIANDAIRVPARIWRKLPPYITSRSLRNNSRTSSGTTSQLLTGCLTGSGFRVPASEWPFGQSGPGGSRASRRTATSLPIPRTSIASRAKFTACRRRLPDEAARAGRPPTSMKAVVTPVEGNDRSPVS